MALSHMVLGVPWILHMLGPYGFVRCLHPLVFPATYLLSFISLWPVNPLSPIGSSWNLWTIHRVDQLVIKHLSAQGKLDPREGLHYFWCSNKTWIPLLGASDTQTILGKGLEMRKLQPPNKGGSRTQKNKPLNTTKASSQTSKKFLVCSSVAVRV
jgi:hypothetical protein